MKVLLSLTSSSIFFVLSLPRSNCRSSTTTTTTTMTFDDSSDSSSFILDGRALNSISDDDRLLDSKEYAKNHPISDWWRKFKASKAPNSTSRYFPNELEAASIPWSDEPYDDPVHADDRRVIKGIDVRFEWKRRNNDDGDDYDRETSSIDYKVEGNFTFSYKKNSSLSSSSPTPSWSSFGEAFYYKLYALKDEDDDIKGYRIVYDARESRRRLNDPEGQQFREISYKLGNESEKIVVNLRHRSDSDSKEKLFKQRSDDYERISNNLFSKRDETKIANNKRDEKILRDVIASSVFRSNGDGSGGGRNGVENYLIDELKIQIYNRAGVALKLIDSQLPWGRWIDEPPEMILAGQSIEYGVRSTVFAGYEASTKFNFDDDDGKSDGGGVSAGWISFDAEKEFWDGRTFEVSYENKSAFDRRYVLALNNYVEPPQRYSVNSYLGRTLLPTVRDILRHGVGGDDENGSDLGYYGSSTPTVSLTLYEKRPSSFRVMIGGDPQPYRLNMVDDNDPNDDEDRWLALNRDRADAILKDHLNSSSSSPFAFGTVLGDLTEYGRAAQRANYVKAYERTLPFPLYVGLGNHDYDNNLGDCWEFGYVTKNGCAITAIVDMAERIRVYARRSLNFHSDWHGTGSWGSGSLSYRFDYGRYRFYQLQNYPSYSPGVIVDGLRRFEILSSLDWLERQLNESTSEKLWPVVMFHDEWSGSGGDGGQGKKRLQTLLKTYGVRLLFSGHKHEFQQFLDDEGYDYWTFVTGALFDHVWGGYYSVTFYDDGCVRVEERLSGMDGVPKPQIKTVCYGEGGSG